MSREHRSSQPKPWEGLKVIHPHAAGLDIGSAEIWAAVPPDSSEQPVRFFGTTTPDLVALAEWLKSCGVDTVAMELTGVYWVRRESRIDDCFTRSQGLERSLLFYQQYPWAAKRPSNGPW